MMFSGLILSSVLIIYFFLILKLMNFHGRKFVKFRKVKEEKSKGEKLKKKILPLRDKLY